MEQQTIQEEEKQQQEPQKSSFLSDVAEILETVFVSIFVVILLFAYVVRPVTVDGGFHAGNPARQGSSADV